jgi:hypothetical protein
MYRSFHGVESEENSFRKYGRTEKEDYFHSGLWAVTSRDIVGGLDGTHRLHLQCEASTSAAANGRHFTSFSMAGTRSSETLQSATHGKG